MFVTDWCLVSAASWLGSVPMTIIFPALPGHASGLHFANGEALWIAMSVSESACQFTTSEQTEYLNNCSMDCPERLFSSSPSGGWGGAQPPPSISIKIFTRVPMLGVKTLTMNRNTQGSSSAGDLWCVIPVMVLANKDMQIPPPTLITAALQFCDSVVVNLGFESEESSELNLKIGKFLWLLCRNCGKLFCR